MPEITRLKTANRRGTRILVEIDGEPWMEIDAEVVLKRQLQRGMAMPEEMREELAFADETVRARRAAARLIQTRLRAVEELRRKLADKDFSERAIDATIAHFEETGDLDDARFAAAFVRHEFKVRTTGPLRVRHKLRDLGVAGAVIDRALEVAPDASADAQRDAARRLIEKRLPRMRGDYTARKRKILGALQRAGFEADVAWPLVSEMLSPDDGHPANE